MIRDISINLTPNLSLNIISTIIFIMCLIGLHFAYNGILQEAIIIIGLIILLRLPFPLEREPIEKFAK